MTEKFTQKYTSPLDEARLNFWKDKFELIVEVKEWEVIILCAKCEMEIPKDHKSISNPRTFKKTEVGEPLVASRSCPHCLTRNYKVDSDNYWVYFKPIPTKLNRRRFVVTQRTKIWGKVKEEGFWEYQEINEESS